MSPYTQLQTRLQAEPHTWLVTGVAGFIGSNLLEALLKLGQRVVGLDNFITGFLNMLVAARDARVKRFVYAASSSTYGDHPGLPKVEDTIGKPLSPYAATRLGYVPTQRIAEGLELAMPWYISLAPSTAA